jgi:hypothetical protein
VREPDGFEQQVAGAVSRLADTERFQADIHRLDILGLCADCK